MDYYSDVDSLGDNMYESDYSDEPQLNDEIIDENEPSIHHLINQDDNHVLLDDEYDDDQLEALNIDDCVTNLPSQLSSSSTSTLINLPSNNNIVTQLKQIISINEKVNLPKKTKKYATKYEYTRIVGFRKKMLIDGAISFIEVPNSNKITNMSIDQIIYEEIIQKKIPIIIKRDIPNSLPEYWKVSDLDFTLLDCFIYQNF